jgi:hypothetical protein
MGKLVANAAPRHMEFLTVNVGGKLRKETLEGRPHLVAPAVILKEEVLNGSEGAGFYPHEENKKALPAWNGMPITLGHPESNGAKVSARSPEVINNRKVGVVLNTGSDDSGKKVKVECWFDEERVKALDKRLYDKLVKNEQVECSTGLYLNQDPVKGTFGTTPYDWIARDHEPDHLAVLVDTIGALSVKMGGGLFANAANLPESEVFTAQRTAENALKTVGIEFVGNEMSFNSTTRQLSDTLSRTYGEKGRYWDGYLEEVFSDHVIFRDGRGKTLKQEYTANDKGVALKGSAVEVVRTVSYKPVAANAADPNLTENKQMDRTAKIAALIGNGYAESDRAWLEKLPDDALAAVKPVPAAKPPETPAAPAANAGAGQVTLTKDQIEAVLGKDFMAVHNFGKTAMEAQKAAIINGIKATGRCPFNDDYLKAQSPEQLTALAQLAGVGAAQPVGNAGSPSPFVPGFLPGPQGWAMPQVNYSLLAGGTPAPVGNAADAAKDDDGLDLPVLNFGKPAA